MINHVLDTTLAREGDYLRKKCTTSEAELTYREVLHLNSVDGEIPNYNGDRAVQLQNKFSHMVQEEVKNRVRFESQEKWEEHVCNLTVQGKTLALAAAEKEDVLWKSYMYNLKAGTLKFLLNASIDTLPTAANLKRWKKSPSDLCKLCRGRQTTNHVLNICSVGKDTGRWEWRHNCVLNYIVSSVNTSKYTVYSDLEGHQSAGGGTVPPEICVTGQRPDIVILDNTAKTINLFELTCPLECNIEKRNLDKHNKYAHFLTDCSGYDCTVTCFEVSSKGFISTRNHTSLATLNKYMNSSIKLSTFKKNISALAGSVAPTPPSHSPPTCRPPSSDLHHMSHTLGQENYYILSWATKYSMLLTHYSGLFSPLANLFSASLQINLTTLYSIGIIGI